MQSNTKALITTLIILLVYLIGWLPAVVNYVLVCNDCIFPLTISLCVRLPVNITNNCLIITKFLVDPIIYTARIQEIRFVVKYFSIKLGCSKPSLHPHSFDRFDTNSRTGSFMTSLRYSTYRPRRESDVSVTRTSPYASRNATILYNGSNTRRISNGSIGQKTFLDAPDNGVGLLPLNRKASNGSIGRKGHLLDAPESGHALVNRRSSNGSMGRERAVANYYPDPHVFANWPLAEDVNENLVSPVKETDKDFSYSGMGLH